MLSLPRPIFSTIQGLCYPRRCNILSLGKWDTSDWNISQNIVQELETNTDVVVFQLPDENLFSYLDKFNEPDYGFSLVIFSYSLSEMKHNLAGYAFKLIKSKVGYIAILLNKSQKPSFLSKMINRNEEIDLDDPHLFLPHFDPLKWSQKKSVVTFSSPYCDVTFHVPSDFSLSRTSPDLLWTIEYVLLSPWEENYQTEWVPTRWPGDKPGLSFSGGVDSTAALCLMPENTVLMYLERDFPSMIKHANAHRFISHLNTLGREVTTVRSNHESIRTYFDKNPGFSTDYACMAHMILLADYADLDAAATGMPLENTYFFHGTKVRDFEKSSFWSRYSPMFSYLGLPLYQPVAGCSEILNNSIVNTCGLGDYATSCLRSDIGGEVCGSCWKCFRKNIFNNKEWKMSPEISTFLSKRPLKQGVATLYALQMYNQRKGTLPGEAQDLAPILNVNIDFLNDYWQPSLDLLPRKYKQFTEEKINHLASKMEINLYDFDEKTAQLLRGTIT